MQQAANWRVSTYSTGTGNCVEVGRAGAAIVVRDTKNREAAPLRVPPAAWHHFTATLKVDLPHIT